MPNNINWTYTGSDPRLFDILVVNSDSTVLNGAFTISRSVSVHLEVCRTVDRARCIVEDDALYDSL